MEKDLMRPFKIVTGGQTGVDRAALDVAIEYGIEHGGWCPLGRVAEDGPIQDHYQLQELESQLYVDRTRKNVLDSDGTLILYCHRLQGGSALTARFAREFQRPLCLVRLDRDPDFDSLTNWIVRNGIRILNVAGPRASSTKGIYQLSFDYLRNWLTTSSKLPVLHTENRMRSR